MGVALMIAMSASYLACLWLFTHPGALAASARSKRIITAGAGALFTMFGMKLVSSGLFA